MEDMFNNILDQDEKIIEVIKPRKSKIMISYCLQFALATWFALLIAGIIIFSNVPLKIWIIVVIMLGTSTIIMTVFAVCLSVYYKNLYFAYSNKRILIRSGIIGIEYKTLDMAMIGAADVYISFIDKLVGKNTGTVSFGSMSNPMGTGSSQSYFKFNHISKPYEKYKEIKQVIDNYKEVIAKGECKCEEKLETPAAAKPKIKKTVTKNKEK